MWNVTRPSGRRVMLVTYSGTPPPSWLLLFGVVYGVKLLFAPLGNGTDVSSTFGPREPSIPCDSSRIGRLFSTRQMSIPSPGNFSSQPTFFRTSSRKYSLLSGRILILKHWLGSSSIGERISCCFTDGSIRVGLIQPRCSLHHAEKCCGRPPPIWLDIASH